VDPHMCGEAYLEMTVAFLRKVFDGESAEEALREIAARYPEFIMEGTNVVMDEPGGVDDAKNVDDKRAFEEHQASMDAVFVESEQKASI